MKITLENTDEVGAIGIDVGDVQVQVPARIWVGSTESGIPVVAFITRIAAIGDSTEFERELSQPPTFVVETRGQLKGKHPSTVGKLLRAYESLVKQVETLTSDSFTCNVCQVTRDTERAAREQAEARVKELEHELEECESEAGAALDTLSAEREAAESVLASARELLNEVANHEPRWARRIRNALTSHPAPAEAPSLPWLDEDDTKTTLVADLRQGQS